MTGEYSKYKGGAERRKTVWATEQRVAYCSHSLTMGSSFVTWAPHGCSALSHPIFVDMLWPISFVKPPYSYPFLFRVLPILPKIKLANLKDYSMLRKILVKYQYIIFWGILTFDWGFPRDKSLKSKGMNLKSWAFHIYRLVPGSFQCSLNQITHAAADFSVHWPWCIL